MCKFWNIFLVLFYPVLLFSQADVNSLLNELDTTIDNKQQYHEVKIQKINRLVGLIKYTSANIQKYEIYKNLYDEYKLYQSDSALNYANKSLDIAYKLNDISKINTSKLNLASIMGTLGMYKEASDIINKIEIKKTSEIKGIYFGVCSSLYLSMSDFAASSKEKNNYISLTKKFRDSSYSFYTADYKQFTIHKSNKLFENKKYNEIIHLLGNYFTKIDKNNIDKAVVAYLISQAYHQKKEYIQEKKWLIISAISDLQLEKKEYNSLRSLAYIMYKEGDIDRAYKYMMRTLNDALFCNARLRTYEISKMMPIINEAYQKQNDTNKKQLILFLVCVSLLSIFLLGILILLFNQMKKLAKAKKEISLANLQFLELNKELKLFNEKLNETNNTLNEANLVKEIYIGRYMDQCSIYISKLDQYRRQLNIMATSGKMNELVRAIKSNEFLEKELKEFYNNFDKTFLSLFPNFIEEFGSLLIDTEDIKLKQGELMNTELRIFALIRLGISDSAKISEFLRYSLSTIYNYRTKLRNKAAGPREDFEADVMRIGTNK